MTLRAWDLKTGQEVKLGDPVTSFRGDSAGTLVSIDRAEEDGRMGKVTTSDHGYGNSNAFGLRVTDES